MKMPGFIPKRPLRLLGIITTVIGMVLVGGGLILDLFHGGHTPAKPGMLLYMVLPNIPMAGLSLIALDLGWQFFLRRRQKLPIRGWKWLMGEIGGLSRKTLIMLGGGLAFIGLGTAVFSSRAYHFTESVEFCGQLCHEPMGPQFAAHQDSPHAHVPCVDCHVGPGLTHYMKAKVSGMHQLQQVALDSFPRPIFAPKIKLRPANETCERCHWQDKFWGGKQDGRVRYGYDLENSRRYLSIQVRVGGGAPTHGPTGGVHRHMLQHKLVFKAVDSEKQELAQFRVFREDGSIEVYDLYAKGERKFSDAQLEKYSEHKMDCLDCHNRPAHQFLSPDETVDRALELGKIDPSLPFIKKVVVAALAKEYRTNDEAMEGLRKHVIQYYTDNFQGKVLERKKSLDKAIEAAQEIYSRNVHPEMNLTWNVYPNNIGHRTTPGCFRCHGNQHVRRSDGAKLAGDCKMCHVFYERSRTSASLVEAPADDSLLHPFRHKKHFNEEINCWDCHSTASPYSQCKSCHKKEFSTKRMQFECSMCHRPRLEKVGIQSCSPCHPTGKSKMHTEKGHANCVACHKHHTWDASTDHASCAGAKCHKSEEIAKWPKHENGKPCKHCLDFKGVELHMKGLPVGKAADTVRDVTVPSK